MAWAPARDKGFHAAPGSPANTPPDFSIGAREKLGDRYAEGRLIGKGGF